MCVHTPVQCSFLWYIMLICTSCGRRFFDTRWCSNTCVSRSHSQWESPAPCPHSTCVSFFDCRWQHYTSITGSRVSSRCLADTLSNALKHTMGHIHATGHVHRTSDMRSVYMHGGQLRWCMFVKILLACVSHLSSVMVASFLLPHCTCFVWNTFFISYVVWTTTPAHTAPHFVTFISPHTSFSRLQTFPPQVPILYCMCMYVAYFRDPPLVQRSLHRKPDYT